MDFYTWVLFHFALSTLSLLQLGVRHLSYDTVSKGHTCHWGQESQTAQRQREIAAWKAGRAGVFRERGGCLCFFLGRVTLHPFRGKTVLLREGRWR